MRLLLDTHVLLWVRAEPERLTAEMRRILTDDNNAVFVSVVSLWEIVIKCRIGKLQADITAIVAGLVPASKLQLLGVTTEHLSELNNLPFHQQHRDPFDHLIIAQAIAEGMTQDRHVALYPVRTMASSL